MNQMKTDQAWQLSFSYGRALQAPCLAAWQGEESQLEAGQKALLKRCKLNSAAERAEYNTEMEGQEVALA